MRPRTCCWTSACLCWTPRHLRSFRRCWTHRPPTIPDCAPCWQPKRLGRPDLPTVGTWTAPAPLAATHDLTTFESGEPALDHHWLKTHARRNEGRGASRAYVVCNDDHVIGYYSLATGSVCSEQAPGRIRRNMPNPIPVMLLGRLAIDLAWQRHGIGKALLRDAIFRMATVAQLVGVKALMDHDRPGHTPCAELAARWHRPCWPPISADRPELAHAQERWLAPPCSDPPSSQSPAGATQGVGHQRIRGRLPRYRGDQRGRGCGLTRRGDPTHGYRAPGRVRGRVGPTRVVHAQPSRSGRTRRVARHLSRAVPLDPGLLQMASKCTGRRR